MRGGVRSGVRSPALALAALALAALSVGAPVGAVEPDVPPAAGAAWLAGLLGPEAAVVDPALDVVDVDATLDLLLGLVAARSAGTTADAVAERLVADVAGHTGAELDATFVAATAKLALVLPATGRDPRAVGGTDLIALLSGRVGPDGRARDRSALGDLSTPRSQALAVLALGRAGADPVLVLRAADALAGEACADGSLPSEFGADPCTTDPVATALAAAALAVAADATGADAALAAARDDALAVLLARRAEGDLDPWAAGITAAALRAVERRAEADAIADELLARLDGCDAGGTGALIDADPLRATVGALLAASGATLTDLSADGADPDTVPLDCTAPAAEPAAGDGVADGSAGASGAADTSTGVAAGPDGSGRGRSIVAVGLAVTVLALTLLAGVPVIRAARRRDRTVRR